MRETMEEATAGQSPSVSQGGHGQGTDRLVELCKVKLSTDRLCHALGVSFQFPSYRLMNLTSCSGFRVPRGLR